MNSGDIFFDFNLTNVQSAVIIGCLLCFLIYYFCRVRNLPPGPWGIPFIGYWPFLKSEGGHFQLQELKEKYGEVFSFTVTGNLLICLNSMKAIKEAHLNNADCFGDRFTGYSLLTVSFEDAVSIINGESWRVQRKFFSQKFKEYGMHAVKESTSRSFHDAVTETVEEIRAMNGQPFSVVDLLTVKCSGVIKRVLFNDQGITDEELKELNHEYGFVLPSMTYKNLLLMGNFARFLIFPFMPTYRKMIRSHDRIQAILTNVINRHKESFDDTQILDLIDCFYKEKKEKEKKGDPAAKYFTDKALRSSIYQFLTDGVLTVAYFIVMFLQFLVERPEEQEKIYKELMEVVGPNRQPTIEDKGNLPYTNAFIYEVIRYSDFFPLFPSNKCTKDTTVCGFRFPKGAITVINIWSAHHDPEIYENPDKFYPARFIATPGKRRPDLPVMFGVGKRNCMGEPFTMIQTFLFVTSIVKNFRLSLPEDAERMKALVDAGDMKICAHPRTQDLKN